MIISKAQINLMCADFADYLLRKLRTPDDEFINQRNHVNHLISDLLIILWVSKSLIKEQDKKISS